MQGGRREVGCRGGGGQDGPEVGMTLLKEMSSRRERGILVCPLNWQSAGEPRLPPRMGTPPVTPAWGFSRVSPWQKHLFPTQNVCQLSLIAFFLFGRQREICPNGSRPKCWARRKPGADLHWGSRAYVLEPSPLPSRACVLEVGTGRTTWM